jgi:type II secretory pathway pseudopilin PulG
MDFYKRWAKGGFTLIEIGIVLVIVSIILGTIVGLVPALQQQDNTVTVNKKLDKLQQAIDTFYAQNGYIPCPARITDAPATATFGIATDCSLASVPNTIEVAGATANENLRTGVVPTRTLNLPDDFMFDSWNTRFDFTVVKNLAISNPLYASYTSAQSDIIRIEDASLNRIPQPNSATYANVVAYVLVSHGPNNVGATNYLGSPIVACGGTLDSENCNNNNAFIDSYYNSNPASFYDDSIRWKTQQQIAREVQFIGTGLWSGRHGIFTEQYNPIIPPGNALTVTRNLNTVRYSDLSHATLNAGGSITLGAGTYIVRGEATEVQAGSNYCYLNNDTDGVIIAYGTGTLSAAGTVNSSSVIAEFTLAATKNISLRHAWTAAPPVYTGIPVNNVVHSELEIFEK